MKKILKDKRIILVGLVIVLVFMLLDFNQRMVLLSKLRSQEKDLKQKYAELVATRDALQADLEFTKSDEAVEKWAREEAAMVQEGDIPIIIMQPANPVITQPPAEDAVIDEIEKWEIWQELFFGD